jgi:hypothetical protein
MKNSQARQYSPAVAVLLSVLVLVPCFAQEVPGDFQELSQWVMTYYQNRNPDEFVSKVKKMSEAGLLHDLDPNARPDAHVMFLGKIMASNAEQIPNWMDALASLPDADIKVLKRAVWYSGTPTGKAWLIQQGDAELANGPRPMLLANQQLMQLEPYHIDQLWEWFFATGEEEPIAGIVSLFSLAHELPDERTLDLLSPPTESDDNALNQIQADNYRLLKPAIWSTASLAVSHDRVLEVLKQAKDKYDHPRIKAWVGQIIRVAEAKRAKLLPDSNVNLGKTTP